MKISDIPDGDADAQSRAAADERGIGDNSGDPFAAEFAKFQETLQAWLEGIDKVKEAGPVTAETEEKRNDFLTGIRKFMRLADKAREAEKAPHLAAGREVDSRWGRITAQAAQVEAIIAKLVKTYMDAKQAEANRLAAEARDRANKLAAEEAAAERTAARAKTESARIAAEARAQELAAAKTVAEREAEPEKVRIGSATGLANNRSLKTNRRAKVVEPLRTMRHYAKHPKMLELLEQLANAEIRAFYASVSKHSVMEIPGVEIITETGV